MVINMDKKFIYVYKEEDKDRLMNLGFKLLKKDDKNEIWCFMNTDSSQEVFDFGVLYSNTLTF
jgi:hypothetical protein